MGTSDSTRQVSNTQVRLTNYKPSKQVHSVPEPSLHNAFENDRPVCTADCQPGKCLWSPVFLTIRLPRSTNMHAIRVKEYMPRSASHQLASRSQIVTSGFKMSAQ